MRLKFVGVDLYESYVDFCQEKKKCSLCSKPITQEELNKIIAKGRKMKEKSLKQIAELEKKLAFDAEMPGVDPALVVPRYEE